MPIQSILLSLLLLGGIPASAGDGTTIGPVCISTSPPSAAAPAVAVRAAPPALPARAGSSGLPLLAIAVAVLLLGGGLLTGFTLRRRPAGARVRPAGTPTYQGHRRRVTR